MKAGVEGGLGKKPYIPEPGNEAPVSEKFLVKLSVPSDLYAEYEAAADKQGLTIQELMLHRLTKCKDYTGVRPLFFSDTQRSQLETLVQKKPLENADQALAVLVACLSIRVGEFPPIPISGQLAKRLAMSVYTGQTVYGRLCDLVTSSLTKAVGL